MSIIRQGVSFLVIGACLVVVDWGVFVLLTSLGMEALVANVLGRVVGAALGFMANGRITFSSFGSSRVGKRHFTRFAVSWAVLTAISTLLITEVVSHLSLQVAWLGKPLVEAALAVVSFIISRHWVYVE